MHHVSLRAVPTPFLPTHSFTRLSLLIAALFLPLPMLYPLPARAQVIADPAAAPHQRPVIHSTANGLPQIDITAPS
ncbi:MAG: hypothetical protein NBV65_01485, partial [Burkholderiaceae bacterium]|nr:hypothetical protein [Burkholderiaceae bacterium]